MNRKTLSHKNRLFRFFWRIVELLLFRYTPVHLHFWRVFVLRVFGGSISWSAKIYPTAKIWAPWNLRLGDYSTIGEHVDCYNVDLISIGDHVTVSQGTFLCTASHDYSMSQLQENAKMPLLSAPIHINDKAWISSHVAIAPGVTIDRGAVVLMKSLVLQDCGKNLVFAGHPARLIKERPDKEPES